MLETAPIKVNHQIQNDEEDRNIIGASMLFGQTEFEEIARLGPGEAFYFAEGYHRPRKIQAINLHERFDLSVDVFNEKLSPYIKDNAWFQKFSLERSAIELDQLGNQMDLFDDERIKIIQQLTLLFSQHPKEIVNTNSDDKKRCLRSFCISRLSTLHEDPRQDDAGDATEPHAGSRQGAGLRGHERQAACRIRGRT